MSCHAYWFEFRRRFTQRYSLRDAYRLLARRIAYELAEVPS